MFLKVTFTIQKGCQNGSESRNPNEEPGSWIVGDVAEVKFFPAEIFDRETYYLPPESNSVKIFSDRMNLVVHPETKIKVNLAQLIVTLKDGNVIFVYFDDEAYLCGDNGKTLEKFSARVEAKDLE
jgi:hypothetical protein